MTAVDLSTSRQEAIDRVIAVMQAEYGTEISAVRSALSQPNLYVPTPETDAYFYVAPDPDEILNNYVVEVYMTPGSDRRLVETGSVGMNTQTELREWELDIDVTFLMAPQQAITRHSKTLGGDEVLQLRAEVYLGAMIDTVLKYGCESGTIHDIDLVADLPQLFFQENRAIGIASAEFRIFQKVTRPASGQALP